MMTGVILAAGRGFGEAAVLLYTTGSGSDLRWNNFSFTSPTSPINVLRPAETLSIKSGTYKPMDKIVHWLIYLVLCC